MAITLYTFEELENVFEIGRLIQQMIENEKIDVEDSKDAFALAVQLATDFEEQYPVPDDYYMDLEEFVVDKIVEKFKRNW